MARARAHGYAVLARLVDGVVDDHSVELARLSPMLDASLGDIDEAAADHCYVFDIHAPAFEGMVRDPQARVGGRVAAELERTLHRLRISPSNRREPEHLAVQLEVLARLCEREAEAADDSALATARSDSAVMLDRHVLSWLLVYEATVRRCARRFPSALISQIVDLAIDHRLALSDVVVEANTTPAATLDLDDPKTDLRAIAEWLARPAASGLLLSRHDITRLGRAARVPRGFGDRRLLLINLLRNASGLDALVPVIMGLQALCAEQHRQLVERAGALADTALVLPSVDRLERTHALLDRVSTAFQRVERDGVQAAV